MDIYVESKSTSLFYAQMDIYVESKSTSLFYAHETEIERTRPDLSPGSIHSTAHAHIHISVFKNRSVHCFAAFLFKLRSY